MARQTSHVIVQPDAPGPKKPSKPRDPVASGERDAAHNRMASHNYFLLEKFEAGVALRGTEVKSIREGKANLKDSYGPHQGWRGVPAERAYWSLFARKYSKPRCPAHAQAAYAQGRGAQATLQDADQRPHAHPHSPLFPQWTGKMRAGRGQRQAGLGQARDRYAAAKPTAKPARP